MNTLVKHHPACVLGEILKDTLGAETGVRVDYRQGEFTFERIEEAVAATGLGESPPNTRRRYKLLR